MFNLYLTECGPRLDQSAESMYQIFLKLFRDEPIKLS